MAASQNECLEEALTIVSFMSADSVFVATTAERRNSDSSKRKFETAEGDHCALLNVFKGYRLARQEKKLKVTYLRLYIAQLLYMLLHKLLILFVCIYSKYFFMSGMV